MAFRIEAAIGAVLIFGTASAFAQPFTYQVRHRHLRGGVIGTLRVTIDSISFVEPGNKHEHSREWKYNDIQQLSLSNDELRMLTYEDQKREFGRDREYVFDQLPKDLAPTLYSMFATRLDQRFIPELADPAIQPKWQVGAKLRHGLGGSEGTLLVGDDRIAYKTDAAGESRTWRFSDIESISKSGPFEFTITSLERSGWRHSGPTEFRFQLKEPLAESRYNELWRNIEEVKSRTAF